MDERMRAKRPNFTDFSLCQALAILPAGAAGCCVLACWASDGFGAQQARHDYNEDRSQKLKVELQQ